MASLDSHIPTHVPLMRQFSKQIAGHAIEKGSSSPGMMKHVDGCLLKPILAPPRGLRELQFYEAVFNGDCKNEVILQLRPFLPSFHGVFKVESENKDYLKLEDLTEKFKNHPCILDLKMGAKTYDFEASENKIKREQCKYKETKALGFCIPGMQVFQVSSQAYICNGKEYGKKLNKETIVDAFRLYLNSDVGVNSLIIQSFLLKLNKIRQWFLMQSQFAFFASSLLLIYEADSLKDRSLGHKLCSNNSKQLCTTLSSSRANADNCCGDSNKESSGRLTGTDLQASAGGDSELAPCTTLIHQAMDENALLNLTEVRMIDFAHVFPCPERDENYLLGLNSVISILEDQLKLCLD